VWHKGGTRQGSQRRDSQEWHLHSDAVGTEGHTGIRPEESSLCVGLVVGEEKGAGAVLFGVTAAPEVDQSGSLGPQRRVDDGDRWLRGCSGFLAWTRGSEEECSGPRRASSREERSARERKEKGWRDGDRLPLKLRQGREKRGRGGGGVGMEWEWVPGGGGAGGISVVTSGATLGRQRPWSSGNGRA
jgi:hypothetical protein